MFRLSKSYYFIKYSLSIRHTFFSTTKCICGNKKDRKAYASLHETGLDDEVYDVGNDLQYEELVKHSIHIPEMGHQVFIIQPYIKWGVAKKRNTTPQLQLAEAVALINTLPKWKVVDQVVLPLLSLEKKKVFGSGNLEMLQKKISKSNKITAVFISLDILNGLQQRELEERFQIPVYDRYTIVIQIFREHAKTKEAKLQVAMAEIPYLWSHLKDNPKGGSDNHGGGLSAVGGLGETYLEVRKRLLTMREIKLKLALQKLRSHRKLLRSKRQKLNFPVVAVVGYTNAGKTSLIKALTGEKCMQPKDQLFATLDVTTHAGRLPSRLEILYMDTVGFISDIPSSLIEAFVATLEDAMLADVILHVRDISHPDNEAQSENVTNTLKGLNLSAELLENVIVVANKMDLVTTDLSQKHLSTNMLGVSSLKHTGIDILREKIEAAILQATGRVSMVFRVMMGSDAASWLYKEAAVTEVTADDTNNQYMLMKVVISKSQLSKFKHCFINN